LRTLYGWWGESSHHPSNLNNLEKEMKMKTVDKYAPKDLSEVIFGNATSKHTVQAVASTHLETSLILYGPRGTGKTTVANLLAQTIGGEDVMIEPNDFKTVLAMPKLKDYLQRGASMARFTSSRKYFVIWHEFDRNDVNPYELWTALDDMNNDIMLILTTNEFIKIHPSLRSRCQAVEMPALTAQDVLPRAQWILTQEGLTLPDAQVLAYLTPQQVNSDLRKYFGELDKLLYLYKQGLAMPPWSPVVTRQRLRVV